MISLFKLSLALILPITSTLAEDPPFKLNPQSKYCFKPYFLDKYFLARSGFNPAVLDEPLNAVTLEKQVAQASQNFQANILESNLSDTSKKGILGYYETAIDELYLCLFRGSSEFREQAIKDDKLRKILLYRQILKIETKKAYFGEDDPPDEITRPYV